MRVKPQADKQREALTVKTVMSLFVNLCGIIRNDYAQEHCKIRPKVDKKQLRKSWQKETAYDL